LTVNRRLVTVMEARSDSLGQVADEARRIAIS
jgi:hypothetical protein